MAHFGSQKAPKRAPTKRTEKGTEKGAQKQEKKSAAGSGGQWGADLGCPPLELPPRVFYHERNGPRGHCVSRRFPSSAGVPVGGKWSAPSPSRALPLSMKYHRPKEKPPIQRPASATERVTALPVIRRGSRRGSRLRKPSLTWEREACFFLLHVRVYQ